MPIRAVTLATSRGEPRGAFEALLRDGAPESPRVFAMPHDETPDPVHARSARDGRRRAGPTVASDSDVDNEVARSESSPTSGWTAGRALAARGVTLLLWAAVACGPAALIASVLAPPPSTAVAPTEAVGALDDRTTRAGALAVTLVGAWLSATAEQPEPLVTLLPAAVVESTRPTAYRDLAVASAAGPNEAGLVTVTVAGLVDEAPATDANVASGDVVDATPPPPNWVPRHFQVTVATAGGLAAVAEPAAVAGPTAQPVVLAQVVDATVPLTTTDEAAMAATLFLSAYLTSSPDLERFTAPNSGVLALAGAPYVAVDVRDVLATHRPISAPASGDHLDVRASVTATTRSDATHVLTYWLTLHARDGRWEVAAIAAGPPATTPPPAA